MNEQDWRLLDADRSVEELRVDGWLLQKGDRVVLRPRARGDVFDLVLEGKTAAVEAIEQDLEGNFLVAVVLEEDPGAYLGLLRQPGHRFFFTPQEVAPLPPERRVRPPITRTVLVAGIGNVFLGDDGFGVEVAQRLAARPLAAGVTVVDYGIRGYDLAYALVRGADHVILVDACPRGEPPGSVFVLEPDLADLDSPNDGATTLDAHDLNPIARAAAGPIARRDAGIGSGRGVRAGDPGAAGGADGPERAGPSGGGGSSHPDRAPGRASPWWRRCPTPRHATLTRRLPPWM